MNRKERRAAQKQSAVRTSPMATVLANAFRAHQAGQLTEAEGLYRDVLAAEPRNAAALHLLGALKQQGGHNDEAISLMLQAIAIAPRDPDYRYNLGYTLIAQGRLDEAIAQLEQATALKPDYAAAHFELGNAFAASGKLPEAETSLKRCLALQPGNADILNNLGRLAFAQARRDDAIAYWKRALQARPDLALAHFNIGLAELNAGDPASAEHYFRRTIALAPDHNDALQHLAAALLLQGKADEAARFASEALSKSESNAARATFAQSLLAVTSFHPDAVTRDRLRRALQEAWIEPFLLAPLCASVIKAHPVIGPAIRRVVEQWPKASLARQHPVVAEHEIAAMQDPLVRAYLEACPNGDIGIEYFLSALRANLLDRAIGAATASETIQNVCASIARQCFVNEYVFNESASEEQRVGQLAAVLQSAIRAGNPVQPIQLSAFAMYRPLHAIEGCERLAERSWPAPVDGLIAQQIKEPAQEAALRGTMPQLTSIENETSLAVQAQYEENPYPRWVVASDTREPLEIQDVVRNSIPAQDCPALPRILNPDILIAGCGTGLQAVNAARTYRNAKILAIDLSRASLAYASRKASELGLLHIEFAVADILKLGSIGRQFDLIESGGVLHHLADPFAGWRSLLSILRPGGMMRIALYSQIARRHVAAARDFARTGNYQADLEGIRLCRQALLRLAEQAPARQVVRAADFYSTSAFRDMVLHRQEQAMSLPDIQSFIAENGIAFSGFEAESATHRAFASRFPDAASRRDLRAWQQFETENPDTFAGMYVFWVRKAG